MKSQIKSINQTTESTLLSVIKTDTTFTNPLMTHTVYGVTIYQHTATWKFRHTLSYTLKNRLICLLIFDFHAHNRLRIPAGKLSFNALIANWAFQLGKTALLQAIPIPTETQVCWMKHEETKNERSSVFVLFPPPMLITGWEHIKGADR